MKRLLILSALIVAILFGCTQVTEDIPNNNNQNQEDNKNNADNESNNDIQESIKITLIGADGKTLDVLTAASDGKVLLSNVKIEDLSHWNTQSDGNGLSYKGTVFFSESLTLHAILLTDETHTITYVLNDGLANPQNSYSFTENDFVALKNPTKDGYIFAGWYEEKDFSGDLVKGWGPGNKTENVTLYAKWGTSEPSTKLTINFDANGTNIPPPEAIKTIPNKNIDLPTIEDSNFSHWNTEPDGKGLSYRKNASFTEDTTLYAIFFTEDTYTITYILNGGLGNPKNPYLFTKDEFVGLENPIRDGYTFEGWYETADFSGNIIKGWFKNEKTSNVILYAKWEKNLSPDLNVTITFDTNGANATTPTLIKTTSGTSVNLPVIEDSKFSHWNTKPDGSGLNYKGTTSFTESVTLYAILSAGEIYTITYMLDNGTANPQNPYSFATDELVALKNPTKDGYIFIGWYETANFSDNIVKGWFAGDKTADVTLYARWAKEYYNDDKLLASDGAGVYSYTIDIQNISNHWDNEAHFSVYLMTDEALKACALAKDFMQAPKEKPIYRMDNYGTLCVKTDTFGNYAVYGSSFENFQYQYYSGVAMTVSSHIISAIVDMTKIVKTDLLAYWEGGKSAKVTKDDIVNLAGYKPYIIDLGKKDTDPNNYVMTSWNQDLMKMTSGATFPTYLEKDGGLKLSHYVGTMTNWNHIRLTDNTFTFTADNYDNNEFCFTIGNWNFKSCGVTVDALDKEFLLRNNNNNNIKFADILTSGNKYLVTLIIKDDNSAYLKVTDSAKATKISINSTNHQTIYYKGADINVTNLTIKTVRTDGTESIVDVKSEMINGFDSSKLGTQTLTVTYGGCTTTYDIEVIDSDIETTEIDVVDIISNLPSGTYKIKVTGAITNLTIDRIRDAINDNHNAKINLDLSETTGLTSIGWGFNGCSNLTSVTIPDSVISIDGWAFSSCWDLTSVIIPNSVTSISTSAFENCNNLENLNEYDNALYLGNENNPYLILIKAKNKSITSCEINTSTKVITNSAFEYCKDLTSITIPDSVTEIGNYAFRNCTSLTSFNVDTNNSNYTSSDNGRILYTKDKTQIVAYPSATGNIIIPNGVTKIKDSEFENCKTLTSVTIPDSVTEIGYNAFSGCSNLTSITIPDSVITINSSAFRDCSSLTSVTIPNNVTTIGYGAFSGCSNLTSITIPDSVISIDSRAFENCNSLNFKEYDNAIYLGNENNPYLILIEAKNDSITSCEVNTSTKIIAGNAFDSCNDLTSITIPDSVITINSSAFYNCSSLTSVTIPDSVTSIGGSAFYNCTGLTSIIIPDSVTSIGSGAFYNCTGLTSIIIPDSVTSIGGSAFYNCTDLTSINVSTNNSNYSSSSNGKILYDKNKTILLKCIDTVTGNIIIPNSVTSISDSAFSNCSNLISITIPNSVTSIGSGAFSGCNSLTSIIIPDSVTTIGSSTFEGCSSLTSITIPDGVTEIGWYTFNWCNNLESITIPDSVTLIGEKTFMGCLGLTNVNYKGTKNQWNKIIIYDYNYYLTGATINYNYTGE